MTVKWEPDVFAHYANVEVGGFELCNLGSWREMPSFWVVMVEGVHTESWGALCSLLQWQCLSPPPLVWGGPFSLGHLQFSGP